ncbi:MAG: hypothetical protein V3U92_11890 [Cellulophaga sp.]
MNNSTTICYKCQETDKTKISTLFGYSICKPCISNLGLLQDATIKRHITSFDPSLKKNLETTSHKEAVSNRIILLERGYISKKIKLLHIQKRLKEL